MKTKHFNRSIILLALFVSALTVSLSKVSAQGITVYQYRHVPQENVEKFLERETKYWSKVAENAVKKGNLTFWALLEKVGGYDLPNSSNYLFVNTFNDIDKVSEVFNPSEALPGMSMNEIETSSLSTVTSMFFLEGGHWEQAAHAQPDDFNYLIMIYHNSLYPDSLINLEIKHWGPFIKNAMDNKMTKQVGWGNASVISPLSEDIKVTTVSYDVFPSLKEALQPTWEENVEFPQEGLGMIGEIEINQRSSVIYRIVKMVQAEQQ